MNCIYYTNSYINCVVDVNLAPSSQNHSFLPTPCQKHTTFYYLSTVLLVIHNTQLQTQKRTASALTKALQRHIQCETIRKYWARVFIHAIRFRSN